MLSNNPDTGVNIGAVVMTVEKIGGGLFIAKCLTSGLEIRPITHSNPRVACLRLMKMVLSVVINAIDQAIAIALSSDMIEDQCVEDEVATDELQEFSERNPSSVYVLREFRCGGDDESYHFSIEIYFGNDCPIPESLQPNRES